MSLKAPLRRSRSDRMIAGVVGGLAKYFGRDPTVARVLYVVISIRFSRVPRHSGVCHPLGDHP